MQKPSISAALLGAAFICFTSTAPAEPVGTAGTIEGTVFDPSGAVVPNATVEIHNPITNYQRSAVSKADGSFRFAHVPPNPYHLNVTAAGFAVFQQDVPVRSGVPVKLKVNLSLADVVQFSTTVEASGADMIENVPYQHNDVDQSLYSKLPDLSPAAGLSDAITFASPGVVADSNGFFHPLGDHAQTSFYIDGQPITDQQSKQFSTQIPLNALQSMELVTGMPAAEYGDKTSLVVNAQTRSGLAQKPFGSVTAQYGSFGTVSEESSFGLGNSKFGNFLVADALRSGRFLDSPEFHPMHDTGNNQSLFDRIDYQPGAYDSIHLNLFAARNRFQVPNTYDQAGQDQRQRVLTWNVAPGYQHTFNARTLLTVNPFVRQDQVDYYPSGDPLLDQPATLAQGRRLTNYGVRADISYVKGMHNLKIGTQVMQTRLGEQFSLGITDPLFDTNSQPGLLPYDLTRGGTLFRFAGKANINEYGFYVQDTLTLGKLSLSPGFRIDRYDGLSQATGLEPRIGASYQFRTGTVVRAAYSRTLETPYNENLVVSSATGAGGLATNIFGAYGSQPLRPGTRNQYNAGLQQNIGRFLLIDAEYFLKHTRNAFDFDTLFNTPVYFPIEWRKSKIDGVSVRLSTPNIKGFQAFTTMGHTRARFFGPEAGGLIFNSPLEDEVFRIDHDQAFQQTTNLRYQRPNNGVWAAFTWRYDSGEVAGAVNSLDDALALSGDQQAAIGFYCGGQMATIGNPITNCASAVYGATRLRIPAPGTANPDHNPPRIAPRHLFDISVGTDNLFHTEHRRTTLRFTVVNLANSAALYNFLSTFSGTHFVTPRAYEAAVGLVF